MRLLGHIYKQLKSVSRYNTSVSFLCANHLFYKHIAGIFGFQQQDYLNFTRLK